MTPPGPSIHVGGNVTGQVAIGDFVYQAQAPGGVVNQIVVPEPIRAKPRPIEQRPRIDSGAIARTASVARIGEAITEGPVQLVGGDGWGKTAILHQAVHSRWFEQHADGVAFVSAFGSPVEDVEQAVFEAFFESHLPGMSLKVSPGQLATRFADVEAGFIIDDLDVPRQHVERVLGALPRCGIVTSASSQTMWSGGSVVDIPGMDVDQALSLFEHRVGRALSTSERETVAGYVESVGGYPMAIAASAAAVRREALSFDDLRSVATAVDPIAEVYTAVASELTLRESRLLAVLAAVDAAPLPSEAIAAASAVEQADEDLRTLRGDGMLQVASPTYRLPSAVAVLLDPETHSPVQGLTSWVQHEQDPHAVARAGLGIVRAMQSAARSGDFAGALRLGRSADAGLATSARWGLWGMMLDEARQAAEATDDQFEQGWAIHQLGTLALAEGDTSSGRQLLEEAATIRRSIGDAEGLANTEHNLSLDVAVAPPSITPPPDPKSGGIPWWAWVMIVAGLVAIAFVVASVVNSDEPERVTTTAPGPGRLTASETRLTFPDVPLDTASSGTVEIINTGPGAVEIGGIDAEADAFSTDDDCEVLETGQACTVRITFEAVEVGTTETRITVDHNGEDPPLILTAVGTAVEPPRASASADPVNVDFGPVPQTSPNRVTRADGDSPWVRTIEIENTGQVPIDITDVTVGFGPFGRTSDCGGLDPGDVCPITVRFFASEPGAAEGVLVVQHTGDNPALEIPLTGVALVPPNLVIEVAGVGSAIDSFFVTIDQIEQINEDFLVVPVAVAITNLGEQPVEDEFFFHIEYEIPDPRAPFWEITTLESQEPQRFRVDTPIRPGESIGFVVDVGVSEDSQPRPNPEGLPAQLRAVVDSCTGGDDPPWPPCRIVESIEEDNVSVEFPFDFRKPTIDLGNLEFDFGDLLQLEFQDPIG